MGKYTSYSSSRQLPKRERIASPIWRGIGLAFVVIIPFLSYVASLVILEANAANQWFRIPKDLIMKGWADPYLVAKILIALVIAFVLYFLFTMITFILYRFLAPSRYGPYDVPQVSYKGKKSVR